VALDAVERVNTDLKKQILQARLAKKMTQAQLAQVCHPLMRQPTVRSSTYALNAHPAQYWLGSLMAVNDSVYAMALVCCARLATA
jgi:hypothetical protein